MNLEHVRTLRLLLAQLDDRVGEIDGETQDVANLVLELNLAKVELGIVYDRVSMLLGNLMVDDPLIDLRDGAQVERKMGSTRKGWNHKVLANVVMDRIQPIYIANHLSQKPASLLGGAKPYERHTTKAFRTVPTGSRTQSDKGRDLPHLYPCQRSHHSSQYRTGNRELVL